MSNALKKITNRAKAIRRSHPKMSWQSAIKAAGSEYRGEKRPSGKSSRRRSKTKRPAVKRRTASVKRSTAGGADGAIHWGRVKELKTPFVSRGKSYFTLSGKRIYFEKRERSSAGKWLRTHQAKFL